MNLKIILIIIGFINTHEQESFDYYASNMRLQYNKVGAQIIDKYPIVHTLTENQKPDFILVVEFPNQEVMGQLFNSQDYKKLVPYREKAFDKLNVYVSKK